MTSVGRFRRETICASGPLARPVSALDFVAPRTPDEAVAALRVSAPGEAAVLAGGTDLLFDLEEGRLQPRRLVSLRHLPWRTLDWNGPSLTVGSTLPLRALENDPDVRHRIPGLYAAVRAVGSVALRQRATLGGNLGRAAPASDLLPVLLALEGEVELVGPEGRRTVPIDRFLRASRSTALQPSELVRSVRLAGARPRSAYLWQRVRPANDISQIGVAVAFSESAGRWTVALGGVPPRPVLAPEAAAELPSGQPDVEEASRAGERLAESPALVSDRRATEEHRRRLAALLCARAVRAALEGPARRR